MAELPCRNENCNSYGQSHPNCRCYGGYAEGGSIESFCSKTRPHDADCHYFAQGGKVESQPVQDPEDPQETVAHAAIHHGLSGLLKNIGKASLQNPEKHTKIFEEAKLQHSERSQPMGEEFKKTLGVRLGDHLADQAHDKMAGKIQGHPLVGSVGKQNLEPILSRLSQPMIQKETHPQAFRGAVDYLHSAMKGDSKLSKGIDDLIGKGDEIKLDSKSRDSLKDYLSEVRDKPDDLFEIGGNLGHYLPDHHGALSSTAARAVDFLNQLEPTQTQDQPLDDPTPVDEMDKAKHHRALEIAEQPLRVLQHMKEGTILPIDLLTLQTIYPTLAQKMKEKMTERIIVAKAKDEYIPYKQKQAMSLFLGQPLDYTQTPAAMQAIIQSAAPQQAQRQMDQAKKNGPKKATGVELKQINKVDSLYETPIERRQIDKKS